MARSLRSGLDVYLGNHRVGQLSRGTRGEVSFAYDRDWLEAPERMPISLSLPLQGRPYAGHAVAAYFDNMLPDSDSIRARIATREGAVSDRPFDLLAAIGRDCVGAHLRRQTTVLLAQ